MGNCGTDDSRREEREWKREKEQTNKTKEYFIFQFMRNVPCAVFPYWRCGCKWCPPRCRHITIFFFFWMSEQPCCAFRSRREYTIFPLSHFAFDFAHAHSHKHIAYSPFFLCAFVATFFRSAHSKIVTIYAFYSAATLWVVGSWHIYFLFAVLAAHLKEIEWMQMAWWKTPLNYLH